MLLPYAPTARAKLLSDEISTRRPHQVCQSWRRFRTIAAPVNAPKPKKNVAIRYVQSHFTVAAFLPRAELLPRAVKIIDVVTKAATAAAGSATKDNGLIH